jgi:hypothetical protein
MRTMRGPSANYVSGVGCKENDIDVTTSVFDQLANRDVGRTTVTWAWLDVNM